MKTTELRLFITEGLDGITTICGDAEFEKLIPAPAVRVAIYSLVHQGMRGYDGEPLKIPTGDPELAIRWENRKPEEKVDLGEQVHRAREIAFRQPFERKPEGKPISQRIDLDGCGWTCPCGSSTNTSDGWSFESDQRRLKEWMKVHAPHSNGLIESYVSADGMRCMASDPGKKTRPISESFPDAVKKDEAP